MRFARDHAKISEEALAAILRQVPEYGNISDPKLLADFFGMTERSVKVFARAASAGRVPTEQELEPFRQSAIRRANQRVPLQAMLHAYRVGMRVLWEWILREGKGADRAEKSGPVVALTGQLLDYINLVSTAVADAYLQQQHRLASEHDRARRDLLEDLLVGRLGVRDDVRARFAALGMQPVDDHLVAIASIGDGEGPHVTDVLRGVAETIARAEGAGGPTPLVVVRHEEVVIVAPLVAGASHLLLRARIEHSADSVRARGITLVAGIGTPCHGYEEIPRGYEEARLALRRAQSGGGVVALLDVPLLDYLLAQAGQTAERMVPPEVRLLLEEDARQDGALVETLVAYMDADLNVGRAASRLIVHPNTVHYRLRKISEITGKRTRSVRDLVDLLAAIRILHASDSAR